MVRKFLSVVAALLAVFHLWLFGSQVWGGELVDLLLVSRWIIAAGLLAALLDLRRRGGSMVRGRQAVSVWLLAALLHGPALARDLDLVAPSMPEVVATVTHMVAGLPLAGAVLLILLFLRRGRSGTLALRLVSTLDAPLFIGALPPRAFLRFAPRPPPDRN